MSVGAACDSGAARGTERVRPLSGVWSLLTRLRRPASSDSLSSAGSDATISFAFLSPPPPSSDRRLTPPERSPLTDSYKKRVRERNERRQHDRDLTLHRKYGLPRGDATFDALSLPHARRSLLEPLQTARDRRAASESLPRCAAHVPGKRRAPPPPRPHSLLLTTSLSRRHSRKRPAPQPPTTSPDTTTSKANSYNAEKENIYINNTLVKMKSNKSDREKRPVSNETQFNFKVDKSVKKDSNVKVPKMKREKSFLQQIFEGRKRNSTLEPPPERILPNISELDKQAAEIIETYRLKPIEQNRDNATTNNGDAWFCTKCLRKYNSTVVTCLYCLPEQNNFKHQIVAEKLKKFANNTNVYTEIDNNPSSSTSSARPNGIAMDEKQKLKEMLREIKDSLPKRSKYENKEEPQSPETENIEVSQTKSKAIPINNIRDTEIKDKGKGVDASKRESYYDPVTLRIGSTPDPQTPADPQPSKQNIVCIQSKRTIPTNGEFRLVKVVTEPARETATVTQPVVFVGPQPKNHGNVLTTSKICEKRSETDASCSKITLSNDTKSQETNGEKSNGHKKEGETTSGPSSKPITLSTLLNPIYIPESSRAQDLRRSFFSQTETQIPEMRSNNPTKSNENASSTTGIKLQSTAYTEPQPVKEISGQSEKTQPKKEPSPAPVNKPQVETFLQNPASTRKQTLLTTVSPSTSNTPLSEKTRLSNANMVRMSVDEHSKRRELVNQLEQSIAKGDELAAAQAAAKLAQLRVACSVLSFSSQIVGESSKNTTQSDNFKPQNPSKNTTQKDKSKPQNPSKNTTQKDKSKPQNLVLTETKEETNVMVPKPSQPISKVNAAVQSMEIVVPKGNCKKSSNKEDANPDGSKIPQSKPEACKAGTPKPDTVIDDLHSAPSTSGQSTNNEPTLVPINVWVEDSVSTRGPVRLWVPRAGTLLQLRRRAELALGLPARLQRWIVDRTLCTDDDTTLASVAGPDLDKPFYLCLVEDTGTETAEVKTKPKSCEASDAATRDVYLELVELEQQALVSNVEPFECGICLEQCAPGAGCVLRECLHAFCRGCLGDWVRHCREPAVTCPAAPCPYMLQEREIRAVAGPLAYERWLALGLAAAESGARHAFHCRTRDCAGWALVEPPATRFPCPVCNRVNCVPCQAIHEGETCEEHRTRLQTAAASLAGETDEGTRALIDELISKGEALECPECSAIITKKWGCDWVKCSACKTEICWVTRGRRWGPAGRGDTSAGCRCGVDGRRCHPTCGYCH